jgi:hypothetical protein
MSRQKLQLDKHILIFALRYALGRKTSAPSIVSDNLLPNLDLFVLWELESIANEINDAELRNHLGDDCDINVWKNVLNEVNKKIEELKN